MKIQRCGLARFPGIINFLRFALEVLAESFNFYRKKIGWKVLNRQILFTGYEALSIIFIIALAIGGIIILEGYSILSNFGQSELLYTILITVITRELGCLLTAFILIARSGTAISTELGNMVINHEIEALLSFGISPITYLVVPRTIGVVVSMVILNIYFNASALLGGWFLATFFTPINIFEFMSAFFARLEIMDIIASMLKSVIFGLIIALISSYQGLMVSIASTEVPQRTIKTVVYSLGWIIVFDIIIALGTYIF